MRAILHGIFIVSVAGTALELFFLDHFEDNWQRVPLVLLAAGLVTGVGVAVAPRPAVLWAHRAVMALFIIGGTVGFYLHYQVNVEFEQEMRASIGGWELFWKSMKGALPSLAPFAMTQFGVLGLILTIKRNAAGVSHERDQDQEQEHEKIRSVT